MKLAIPLIVGLFVLFASTESRELQVNYAKINCLIKTLKDVGQLVADYPEFNVEKPLEDCEDQIKNLKKECYHQIALTFRRKPDFGKYTKCIMDDLRLHFWVESMMKEVVFSSETLPEAKKKVKVENLKKANLKTAQDTINSCIAKHEAAEFHDSIAKPEGWFKTKLDNENYCIRKHLVENNLINTTVYNVVLNPENLDVSNVNCDETLRQANKEMVDLVIATFKDEEKYGFNSDQVKCALEKLREVKVTDRAYAIVIMGELGVSKEQIKKEKKSFKTFYEKYLSDCEKECK